MPEILPLPLPQSKPPWTEAQVALLARRQAVSCIHPYACCGQPMWPRRYGLRCVVNPWHVQMWVHGGDVTEEGIKALEEHWESLKSAGFHNKNFP